MEDVNKRKIELYTTLIGKYIYKKSIKNDNLDNSINEDATCIEKVPEKEIIPAKNITPPPSVGKFQLVVIKKLPWYKKIWKGIIGIIGLA